MKIIKFKKEHVAGFKKNDVAEVKDLLADRLIGEGIAEKGTQKELEAFREKVNKIRKNTKGINAAREAVNAQKEDCEECGGNDEPCEECGDKGVAAEDNKVIAGIEEETKTHTLTEQDLKDYPEPTEGMKVGDVVEMNAAGSLLFGEDGKFIIVGNSEGSQDGPSSNGEETTYHVLNEEDLKANPELTEGLEVGTEVEIDKDGNFIVVDSKLVVKPVEK